MKSRTSVFFLMMLVSCAAPEEAIQDRLSSLLESHGYTAYTPFRTRDLPGSVFVLSRNHKGAWTEFAVSDYHATFDVPPASLFDQDGQEVEFADQLTEEFVFDGSAGLDYAKWLVSAELAGKYARSISMRFSDPKRIHRMTLATLNENKGKLSKSTREVLAAQKEHGTLENAYLVVETLRVQGLSLVLHTGSESSVDVAVAALANGVGAKGRVSHQGGGRIEIRSDRPLVIGYKAIGFPDPLLRDLVSPASVDSLDLVDARLLGAIKRGSERR